MLLEKLIVCSDCNSEFIGIFQRGCWQSRCSTCTDIKRRKPTVVRERRSIAFFPCVEIVALPCQGQWVASKAEEKDLIESFQIHLKGSNWGASWVGRVDLYARKAFEIGKLCSVEVIEVEHQLRDADFNLIEKCESRRYIRLDEVEEFNSDELKYLCWLTASKDTTLKSLNQYETKVREATAPLWHTKLSGECRSGRMGTDAILAVCQSPHALWVESVGHSDDSEWAYDDEALVYSEESSGRDDEE